MSEASESARVQIVLADYGVDQQGKVTLVGAGISVFGLNPAGFTAPLTIWATVTCAPEFVGHRLEIELSLETEDGKPVYLPSTPDNQAQARQVRVATYEALAPTSLAGFDIRSDIVRPKQQILLAFQGGLKLDAGQLYRWRVTVDGDTREEWTELMHIPTAITPPSFG
jgi:hypothetical protein